MKVRWGLSNLADREFRETIETIAMRQPGARICEIGGGANPTLPTAFVKRYGIDYTVVDISAEELAKAPEGYRKVQADVTASDHGIQGPFDLIFSKWCAEHVGDGERFHRNVLELLADGGHAVHLFPTLYSPPFVVNRLMPEWLSHAILLLLQPHREDDGNHGKFPAYYRWCRGPSPAQIARFEDLGYTVEEYSAYFGHSGRIAFGAGYLDRVPILCRLHERICRNLVLRPRVSLTSYAYVVLEKPQSQPSTATEPETSYDPTARPATDWEVEEPVGSSAE